MYIGDGWCGGRRGDQPEIDEELDTDMVVFRVGELGGQCGNWSDDVGSCGDHPHQQLQ